MLSAQDRDRMTHERVLLTNIARAAWAAVKKGGERKHVLLGLKWESTYGSKHSRGHFFVNGQNIPGDQWA
jgi:hypothetical protein